MVVALETVRGSAKRGGNAKVKNVAVQEGAGAFWMGADVAKATFEVALVRPGESFPQTPLRGVPAQSFARTAAGAAACLAWARALTGEGAQVRLVMEATGAYSAQLAGWLEAQCPTLGPAIVNPARTSAYLKSMGLRNKTDRMEARALAFYGAERRPAAYEALDPARAELRALSRFRDVLVRDRVALGNRALDMSASKLVRTLEQQSLRQLARRIEKVELEMAALIKRTPVLKRDYDLLVSIDGVAFVTATAILAELGDLKRFARARQLSAFVGVSPQQCQSGTSVNGRPRLCKQGNPRVRQALYLAAMTTVRGKGKLAGDFKRLVEAGKAPKAALCAIMRKLLIVMRAIVISGDAYCPDGIPKHDQMVENAVEISGTTPP